MSFNAKPLVSIATPVYNSEQYLQECIDSIIAQTYENWEYVIVNNCSTDKSLEIAQKYSQADSRIRICNNTKFLKLFDNWNHMLRQISPKSKYCKVVHADDWLFPECIDKMVEVAEANPTIGIVGAYRLDGDKVNLDGLPYQDTLFSGRDICRKTLLGDLYLFGSPTSILIRSDQIRRQKKFYKESSLHADKEVCFDILKNTDFGFVHQVLTYSRRHDQSITSLTQNLNTHTLGKIRTLKKFGPLFLNHEDYSNRLNEKMRNYHRFLAKGVFEFKGKKFWDYQRKELNKNDLRINPIQLIAAILMELANFRDFVRKMKLAIRMRRNKG